MIFGIPPFYNINQLEMYKNIKEKEVKFPNNIFISEEGKNIILHVIENFFILVITKKLKIKVGLRRRR